MDTDYSNREIDSMVKQVTSGIQEAKDDLLNIVDAYMTQDKIAHQNTKESLERIETQTIKTNGRVNSLEKSKYLMIGGLGVLVAIVVPILTWALLVLVNINNQVQTAVTTALSAYNINNGN